MGFIYKKQSVFTECKSKESRGTRQSGNEEKQCARAESKKLWNERQGFRMSQEGF